MEQGVAQPPRSLRRTDRSVLRLWRQSAFPRIAVDRTQPSILRCTTNDGELGFYSSITSRCTTDSDFNVYRIFCDVKSNRDSKRLPVLARCLSRANLTSSIDSIQSPPSHEVALIQLCDLLLGAASSRINDTLREGHGQGRRSSARIRAGPPARSHTRARSSSTSSRFACREAGDGVAASGSLRHGRCPPAPRAGLLPGQHPDA